SLPLSYTVVYAHDLHSDWVFGMAWHPPMLFGMQEENGSPKANIFAEVQYEDAAEGTATETLRFCQTGVDKSEDRNCTGFLQGVDIRTGIVRGNSRRHRSGCSIRR